jgi:hypothetical protein
MQMMRVQMKTIESSFLILISQELPWISQTSGMERSTTSSPTTAA